MHLLMAYHRTIDVYGDRKREYRALANFRLDPNASSVHLDDAPGDWQTKPGSALPFGRSIIRLLELPKNFVLIRRGDTRSGVAHGDREGSVRYSRLDDDLAVVGELDGVANEVE